MAGDPPPSQAEKFFNTYTAKGRRNCTVGTFAFIAGLYLFMKFKPSSKK